MINFEIENDSQTEKFPTNEPFIIQFGNIETLGKFLFILFHFKKKKLTEIKIFKKTSGIFLINFRILF